MASHRHKRARSARLKPRAAAIAGPLAVVATAGAVTFGVLAANPDFEQLVAVPAASDVSAARDGGVRDLGSVSREFARGDQRKTTPRKPAPPTELEKVMAQPAVAQAIQGAEQKLWTTEALNLWTQPGDEAGETGEIDAGKQVLITGRELYGREEIVLDGQARWVTAGYLSAEEPFSLGGDCSNGTSVESGVSPNIVAVHEAVCAEFPEITTYGTFRGDGEHAQGLAVDIMVSGDRGWEVAEFVRKYYSELGVNYIIYSQNIWSVDRSGEGWRGMEDRGSTTANHYDHVHVTTY